MSCVKISTISGIVLLVAAPLCAAADEVHANAPVVTKVSHTEPVAGDRRITLNIARGDIIDALRLVAEQGGLNLVIGPEVKGEVSVYLTDASLETALKAITVNNGFSFHVQDGVIVVS